MNNSVLNDGEQEKLNFTQRSGVGREERCVVFAVGSHFSCLVGRLVHIIFTLLQSTVLFFTTLFNPDGVPFPFLLGILLDSQFLYKSMFSPVYVFVW